MKCVDGICRKECKISSSSCPIEKPIRCADGSCVDLMVYCASPRCEADRPFMCPDSTCKDNMAKCKYPLNINIIKQEIIDVENNVQTYYLRSQKNEIVGTMFTKGTVSFDIKGVPLSEIDKSQLSVSSDYDYVYLSYLSKRTNILIPQEFIRSSIIKVNLDTTKYDPGKGPLIVNFKTDTLNTNTDFIKYKTKVN